MKRSILVISVFLMAAGVVLPCSKVGPYCKEPNVASDSGALLSPCVNGLVKPGYACKAGGALDINILYLQPVNASKSTGAPVITPVAQYDEAGTVTFTAPKSQLVQLVTGQSQEADVAFVAWGADVQIWTPRITPASEPTGYGQVEVDFTYADPGAGVYADSRYTQNYVDPGTVNGQVSFGDNSPTQRFYTVRSLSNGGSTPVGGTAFWFGFSVGL